MKMKGSDPGVVAAAKRNPNRHPSLNDAPCGPHSHSLGHKGDSGMQGNESASGKNGEKFTFK